MPANTNDNVLDLLSWHGHDKGGVRVPFGEFGEPLGRVLETGILGKLRDAAAKIAAGGEGPRWLFLVGGPGNGKSQMVEEFVRSLGAALQCEDELVEVVSGEFRQSPTPRRVEIRDTNGTTRLGENFRKAVSKLIIIQDASASDRSDRDAAEQLTDDILDLLTEPRPTGSPVPLLICCINRGLLARTLMTPDGGPAVIDLLQSVTRATGLGEEALQKVRLTCWPVQASTLYSQFPELRDAVACWPMDVESLLYGYDDGGAPAAAILADAVAEPRWEESGCADCDYCSTCPLYQNAKWLRQPERSGPMLKMLRRQELATGLRWNFRSLFSLAAELIVGEWGDFTLDKKSVAHPCVWVHQQSDRMASDDAETSVPAAFALVERLYPHALFVGVVPKPGPDVQEAAQSCAAAETICTYVTSHAMDRSKAIRRRLETSVAPTLDPARWSPADDTDQLYDLEDAYSQAMSLGNDAWPPDTSKSAAEDRLFSWLVRAEEEFDELSVQLTAKALAGERYIRQLAATIAKRSVATRLGRHADEQYLADYESTIRDPDRLAELQVRLRDLLSGRNFRANALATFGQPENVDGGLVLLVSNPVQVFPIRPAPAPSSEHPAHDLPAIPVAKRAIPLTFDLFVALKLRERGCYSGSMPASVRAALDRMKQLYAGDACRNEQQFLAGDTYFEIDKKGRVIVASERANPKFIAADGL